MQLGAQLLMHAIAFGAAAKINMHETAFLVRPQYDYVHTLLLGRGPMSMHAIALFNQATGVYAIRGPINYACNCLWGQSEIETYIKPHFGQAPK